MVEVLDMRQATVTQVSALYAEKQQHITHLTMDTVISIGKMQQGSKSDLFILNGAERPVDFFDPTLKEYYCV